MDLSFVSLFEILNSEYRKMYIEIIFELFDDRTSSKTIFDEEDILWTITAVRAKTEQNSKHTDVEILRKLVDTGWFVKEEYGFGVFKYRRSVNGIMQAETMLKMSGVKTPVFGGYTERVVGDLEEILKSDLPYRHHLLSAKESSKELSINFGKMVEDVKKKVDESYEEKTFKEVMESIIKTMDDFNSDDGFYNRYAKTSLTSETIATLERLIKEIEESHIEKISRDMSEFEGISMESAEIKTHEILSYIKDVFINCFRTTKKELNEQLRRYYAKARKYLYNNYFDFSTKREMLMNLDRYIKNLEDFNSENEILGITELVNLNISSIKILKEVDDKSLNTSLEIGDENSEVNNNDVIIKSHDNPILRINRNLLELTEGRTFITTEDIPLEDDENFGDFVAIVCASQDENIDFDITIEEDSEELINKYSVPKIEIKRKDRLNG